MPRLQDRIRRDKHWEIIRVYVIIDIGKAAPLHALADDESIGLKHRRFGRVESEIKEPLILNTVRGVPDHGINAEEVPIIGRGRIKGNLRQILIRRLVRRKEIIERKLSELLELLTERRAVAVDRVAATAASVHQFYVGHHAIKTLVTRGRHGHAQTRLLLCWMTYSGYMALTGSAILECNSTTA
mgnify:CR=1 FL=1